MSFKKWISEAIVKSNDLANALKKTLEFNVEGKWEKVESRFHNWYKNDKVFEGYKFNGVLKHPKANNPDFFFLSAHAILEKPIQNYDSITGDSGLRIVASFFYFDGLGGYQKLGERSNLEGEYSPAVALKKRSVTFESNGPSLKTPFELSEWINYIISKFKKNDDNDGDDDDKEPEISPSPSFGRSLAKV
jgi:hypothetical protein